MPLDVEFEERYSAILPALALLLQLGWTYLTPAQALKARNGKASNVVLQTILRRTLKNRQYQIAGTKHTLSKNAIDRVITEICNPQLQEELLTANEKIYNLLIYGVSVTDYCHGKTVKPTVALIDWQNPANNTYTVTEEFIVIRSGGVGSRCPGMVCFVNGIPLVVIEGKPCDTDAAKNGVIQAAISQCLSHQRPDEIPRLFVYSQLLLAINGSEGCYGTCGTPQIHWAVWREEEISDREMRVVKHKKPAKRQLARVFEHRPETTREWFQKQVADGEARLTGQDRLIIGLLSPARLLEMIRFYVLFDKRQGKMIARYPQVFAIKRLLEHLSSRSAGSTEPDTDGIIWHTAGSGQTFTTLFLAKVLILNERLTKYRSVVLSNRMDAENPLSTNVSLSDHLNVIEDTPPVRVASGKRLAELIGAGNERLVFSYVQKFNTAIQLAQCKNNSADILVVIDASHGIPDEESRTRIKRVLPNAVFVVFTGAPLPQQEKKSHRVLYSYTAQQGVADKTITPLLYEERVFNWPAGKHDLDGWFERVSEGISKRQKVQLQRKLVTASTVTLAENRIQIIALDIANHFMKHRDTGLKAQLLCDSEVSAISYKKYLDETGLFESAVLPGSTKGEAATGDGGVPGVAKGRQKNTRMQDGRSYRKQVMQRFTNDATLKLLIVVDQYLAGFNEPKNSVLYIDKPLSQDELLRAVARVNRLHAKKKFGYIIDYRGCLAALDTRNQKYQNIPSGTQCGYDIKDLTDLYRPMRTEYERLPQLEEALWAIFDGVKDKGDNEQLRLRLAPKFERSSLEVPVARREWVDVHWNVRNTFYETLDAFSNGLTVALQSAGFFTDSRFSDIDRSRYKRTLEQLAELRQRVRSDTDGALECNSYTTQEMNPEERHVAGTGVREVTGTYETDAITQHELEKHAAKRQPEVLPNVFNGNQQAQAYYSIFKQVMPEVFSGGGGPIQDTWVAMAFETERVVNLCVAENSINRQNIEAAVYQRLLPRLYQECRAAGRGLDCVKHILENVVTGIRVGPNAR